MNGTDLRKQSLPELISSLTEQLSHLVRAELALAKAELFGNAKHAAVGGGMLSAAAVFGFTAWLALIGGAIAGIAVVLPVWASALIVGGGLLLIAGLLALLGRSRLQRGMKPLPMTTSSVRKDVQELSAHASRNGTRTTAPAPAQRALPPQGAVPPQRALPAQGAVPAQRSAPAQDTARTQPLVPAQRAAPQEAPQRQAARR